MLDEVHGDQQTNFVFAADDRAFEAAELARADAHSLASGEPGFGQRGREITLIDGGDAAARLWTRRALERAGCFVTPEALDQVAVLDADGRRVWRFTSAGAVTEYDSLAGLVAALREGA